MHYLVTLLLYVALVQSVLFPGYYRDMKPSHLDFQKDYCHYRIDGLLKDTLLADGTPDRNPTIDPNCIRDLPTWYHRVPDVNVQLKIDHNFTLQNPSGLGGPRMRFGDAAPGAELTSFPIDNMGWGNANANVNPCDTIHNYLFTLQVHCQFQYSGTEPTFEYWGDDDYWVYVNRKLALDAGGKHPRYRSTFRLQDVATKVGITAGTTVYDMDFFIAERHCNGYIVQIDFPENCQPDPSCNGDQDSDGIPDCEDNCRTIPNPGQEDCNHNGLGDACDKEQSRIDYPYETTIQVNFDSTTSYTSPSFQYGFTSTWVTVPNAGTPHQITLNDLIPSNTLPDHILSLTVNMANSGTENCILKYQFTSAVGSSDVRSLISLGNVTGVTTGFQTETRIFDLAGGFWNYAFKPVAGNGTSTSSNPGVNTLVLTLVNPSCNGKLKVGHIAVSQRYSRPLASDDGDYYTSCLSNNTCLYGTLRFGGYCACWSGAYGRQCVMQGATPGNYGFPDIESQIPGAWDPAGVGKGADNSSVYFGLDLAAMKPKTFLRNFTGHPSCANNGWGKVFDLETTAPPQLDFASFSEQKLVMRVSQPMVDGRADGAVFLNQDDLTLVNQHADCVYPKSVYISKEVSGCNDVWNFRIPWVSARTCFWTVKDEDSFQVYTGKVIVHNQEYVGTEEWRIIRSILRVKIRFQRYVTVETSDQNFSNDKMQKFAITKQIVGTNLGDPALIEIGTLLQWPFELYNFSMTKAPAGKIANYDLFYDGCNSVYGQQCRQYYRTSLYLTEGTCTLDGDYELTFDVNCDELNQGNCTLSPSKPEDYVLKVQYKLKSENFCATISVDIGIIGKIGSYDNQSFVGSKSNFIIGRRVYYLVKVNSDLNEPKVNGVVDIEAYDTSAPGTIIKFTKTELVTVQIKLANQTRIKIWENKATVGSARFLSVYGIDFKTDCQSHTQSLNPTTNLKTNSIGFSFIMTREVASPPKAGKVTITVLAEVQVTYPKQGAKKRVDDSDSGTEYAATTDIEDDSPITDTTTSTGATDTVTTTGATTGTDTTPTSATTATTTTASTTTTNVQPSDSSNALALFVTLMMLIATLI